MKKAISEITVILLLASMLTLAFNNQTAKSSEPPATEWSRTYGGPGDDAAWCMIQTDDGGYAILGYTYSFGAGQADVLLIKTDATGNMQWNRTYGDTDWERGYCLIHTNDGGYAIAGEKAPSPPPSDRDFWLIKTDANGNMQWNKTYGGTSQEEAYCVIQTSDGGYAIAGRTLSFGVAGYENMWLVKTDSNGTMEWNEAYGGAGIEIAFSVVQTSDGEYVIGGETGPWGNVRDVWLVKTYANGTMQWNKTYGVGTIDYSHSMVQTKDGGYALAGGTEEPAGAPADFYLVKTDADGTMQWNKTYGGTGEDAAWSVVQTSDGGYAIAGGARALKTDSAGNVQWNKTYGEEGTDWAYSVIQADDGGYALAGWTESSGAGGQDFWLMKLARAHLINLTPDTGFSCTTVVGSGFATNSKITISWDGTTILTVPSPLITDSNGSFTAIISVLTQNDPGSHTVKATDESGNWASATFTVIDMTGPQGPPGQKGDTGDTGPQGPQGPPGETRELPLIVDAFTIAASIIAICIATIALLRKKT